jgi:aspartate aminotransferase
MLLLCAHVRSSFKFCLRYLVIKDGHDVGIAQSFAKNFGLYGERVGSLTFLGANEKEAQNLESQLKILVRPMYSNPPVQGARIVQTILSDPQLTAQWYCQSIVPF